MSTATATVHLNTNLHLDEATTRMLLDLAAEEQASLHKFVMDMCERDPHLLDDLTKAFAGAIWRSWEGRERS